MHHRLRTRLDEAGCRLLSRCLTEAQLDRALRAAPQWKQQPLARVLLAPTAARDDAAVAAMHSTERAVRSVRLRNDEGLTRWLTAQLDAACDDKNFTGASSRLAELRAVGDLLTAGFDVAPVARQKDKPTPDFKVVASEVEVCVEVHAKQMNGREAAKVEEFLKGQGGVVGRRSGNVVFREHDVSPAGALKAGENVGLNVASKFADIKRGAHQAASGVPTILWLDLHDEDWWPAKLANLEPVVSSRGAFWSVGFWHAVYGGKGIPVFENQIVWPRPLERVPAMQHEGLFKNAVGKWSGVLWSMSDGSTFFEDPESEAATPPQWSEGAINLPGFSFERAWMSWPQDRPTLLARVRSALEMLKSLAEKARHEIV